MSLQWWKWTQIYNLGKANACWDWGFVYILLFRNFLGNIDVLLRTTKFYYVTSFCFDVPDNHVRFIIFGVNSCFFNRFHQHSILPSKEINLSDGYSVLHPGTNFVQSCSYTYLGKSLCIKGREYREDILLQLLITWNISSTWFLHSLQWSSASIPTFFLTQTYQILNSTYICFKMRCNIFISDSLLLFRWFISGNLGIFAYISVQWFLQVQSFHNDLRYFFGWSPPVLRCSYLQF